MKTCAIATVLTALTLTLPTACSNDKDAPSRDPAGSGHGPGDGHDHGKDDAHAHGATIDLGTAEIAGLRLEAKRGKDLVAGGRMELDLEFPAGRPLPTTTRAWIGAEGGVGSRKARLEREGDRGMHGSIEVPTPLASEARLWVEIEAGDARGKGSFALKP